MRDLETIAETARSLFEPENDPSDKVWANIQDKLREQSALDPGQDGEEQLREID